MADDEGSLNESKADITSGSPERIVELSKKVDINDVTVFDGSTALHVAAENDDLETCRLLLELGADVTAVDTSGVEVASYPAMLGMFDVTKLLVLAGCPTASVGLHDMNLLHCAVFNQYNVEALALPVVELVMFGSLLGSNKEWQCQNQPSVVGHTPLHIAAMLGFVDVAAMLIALGSNVFVRSCSNNWQYHFVNMCDLCLKVVHATEFR